MTDPEAIMLLMDAFPAVKVESCVAGTKEAVMMLAIRRSNAARGPERRIGSGGEGPSTCPVSALRFGHGTSAKRVEAGNQAAETKDTDGTLFAEAV